MSFSNGVQIAPLVDAQQTQSLTLR